MAKISKKGKTSNKDGSLDGLVDTIRNNKPTAHMPMNLLLIDTTFDPMIPDHKNCEA